MKEDWPDFGAVLKRAEELKDWLAREAPEVAVDQKHLDHGTSEQAYWHYGYCCALRDVLRLLEPNQKCRKQDIPSRCH